MDTSGSPPVTAPDPAGSSYRRIPTILVVDDDAKFLAKVQSWLADRGIEFVCAQTCQAAVRAARVSRVDLALLIID
jgi:DNA-binding response OmpR family regulator